MLEQLGLDDAADRLVRGYSGGMRRRLDLGASLVGAPRLLLLDEPTTGLDPRSRIELWDAIRSLVAAGTDVLLTTQYLEEADQLADHVVIIDHGKAIATGTPGELKSQAGRDRVEIRVRHAADLPAAAEVLAGLSDESPAIDEPNRAALPVGVSSSGTDRLSDAIRSLAEQHIDIDDVGLRRPTLDEVFLALTGRPADESTDPTADHAIARLKEPAMTATITPDTALVDIRPDADRVRRHDHARSPLRPTAAPGVVATATIVRRADRQAVRPHAAAHRARRGDVDDVPAHLPLRVRRRDRHRLDQLRRLPDPRARRRRRLLLRDGRCRRRRRRRRQRACSTGCGRCRSRGRRSCSAGRSPTRR